MAENTQWVLEYEDVDQIALWMHNGHVRRTPESNEDWDTDLHPTGMHLADWYGKDYYVVGMEFNQGAFQASGPSGRGKYVVDPAPEGTPPAVLSRLEMPYAFVDMRGAYDDDLLGEWLAEPRRWSSIGAPFDPEEAMEYRFIKELDTGRRFDGLLFVEETEMARPLKAPGDESA